MLKCGKDMGQGQTNQWSSCVKGVMDDDGEDEDTDDDNDHVLDKYNEDNDVHHGNDVDDDYDDDNDDNGNDDNGNFHHFPIEEYFLLNQREIT